MLTYLLKSGACLGILLVFYKLFLERERMHQFKRYYLLAALVLSLSIPVIVFTELVEKPATTYTNVQYIASSDTVIQVPPALEADAIDIAPHLWGIYFIGLLFFGFKFIRNLFQIYNRIRENPKYKFARFTQVLLTEKLPPHTFFSYIFLNKKKLEADKIPKEVLIHEETHAAQKHSWDVVFIEFLQVIFWINPFIYLAKKAIKLNHEFLADQAVLNNNIDETTYQNTLLSYLSPNSKSKYQPTMANRITNSSYSSIKKRFKIMKTNTSKKSVLVRSLLPLPLLAVLLYSFSETKIVEKEIEIIDSEIKLPNSNIKDELENINALQLNYSNNEKVPEQIQYVENWQPTANDFKKWTLNQENITVYIHGTSIGNINLNNYNPDDFYHFFIREIVEIGRTKQSLKPYALYLYTKEEFDKKINIEMGIIEISVDKDKHILVNDKPCTLEQLTNRIKELKTKLKNEPKRGPMTILAIKEGTPNEFVLRVEKHIHPKRN